MKRYLHGTGVLFLAIAGSALLVLVVSQLTNMLTVFDRPAAAYLPAESTLAVFHRPSQETLDAYAIWFPALSETNVEDADALALIDTKAERLTPLLFSRLEDAQQESEESVVMGAYRVSSSEKEILNWVYTFTGTKLAHTKEYGSLRDGRRRGSSWVFVKREAVPATTSLSQGLLQGLVFQNADVFGFEQDESGVHSITIFGEKTTPEGKATPLPQTLSGNVVLLHLLRGEHVWQNLQGQLSDEGRIIFSGVLQQLLHKGFGDVVSMEYDMLPLIQNSVTFSLQRNSSGTLLATVRGHVDDQQNLEHITERLHEGMRLKLPTTAVKTYVFDSRFATRNIRSDKSALTEELYIEGDWHIRSTRAVDEETGLFTALHKGVFIIANTQDQLMLLLEDEEVAMNTSGWMDINTLSPLLREHLPAFVGETSLPMLKDLPARFGWSVEGKGPLIFIRIRPN